MSRFQSVCDNWADITGRLLRDKKLLVHFLLFSARMYKQSFADAALIYQQNPIATKVATLETWNKLGRLVNKGEHSIAVFGEDKTTKHLFDITQTNGKRVLDLWKLTEDLSDENIKTYQQSFVSAVRFMVSNRCEMDGDMKISGRDTKSRKDAQSVHRYQSGRRRFIQGSARSNTFLRSGAKIRKGHAS